MRSDQTGSASDDSEIQEGKLRRVRSLPRKVFKVKNPLEHHQHWVRRVTDEIGLRQQADGLPALPEPVRYPSLVVRWTIP